MAVIIYFFFFPRNEHILLLIFLTPGGRTLEAGEHSRKEKGGIRREDMFTGSLLVSFFHILREKNAASGEHRTRVFPEHFPLFSNDMTLVYLGGLLSLASCVPILGWKPPRMSKERNATYSHK